MVQDILVYVYTHREHPHLREEKELIGIGGHAAKGSPPLAWGKFLDNIWANNAHWITPTRVGKTIIYPT